MLLAVRRYLLRGNIAIERASRWGDVRVQARNAMDRAPDAPRPRDAPGMGARRWLSTTPGSATTPMASHTDLSPFPYGYTSWERVRDGNMFHVDRSPYIRVLEQTTRCEGHAMFFRPPRFGKSLFLDMMHSYYDVSTTEDQWRRWFGDLAIGRDPTPEARQWHVLHLDFSIDTSGGLDKCKDRLDRNINDSVRAFCDEYNADVDVDDGDALSSMKRIARWAGRSAETPRSLLILVDEYDRFANKLLFEMPDIYDDMVRGRSGDPYSSPVRAFYETLKSLPVLARGGRIRSITTGLTPLALHDASGFNVARDLTLDPDLGGMFGFTRNDLRDGLALIPDLEDRQVDAALAVMQHYYNGYRFPGSEEALYMPQLAVYFLENFSRNTNHFRNKVVLMADQLGRGEAPFVDAGHLLYDKNVVPSRNVFSVLERSKALQRDLPSLQGALAVRDKVLRLGTGIKRKLNTADLALGKSLLEDAVSFMYYQGMVTLTQKAVESTNLSEVQSPNELVRSVMIDALLERVRERATPSFSHFVGDPSAETLRGAMEVLAKNEIVINVKDSGAMRKAYGGEATLNRVVTALMREAIPVVSDCRVWTEVDPAYVGDEWDAAQGLVEPGKVRCDMLLLPPGRPAIVIELKTVLHDYVVGACGKRTAVPVKMLCEADVDTLVRLERKASWKATVPVNSVHNTCNTEQPEWWNAVRRWQKKLCDGAWRSTERGKNEDHRESMGDILLWGLAQSMGYALVRQRATGEAVNALVAVQVGPRILVAEGEVDEEGEGHVVHVDGIENPTMSLWSVDKGDESLRS